jgi:hypothetical protein
MSNFGHGSVGTRENPFTNLLDLRTVDYPIPALMKLADLMKSEPDTVKDGADPEENLLLPSGYTYFGQFIDHDLTFDNTSSLNPADVGQTNRTPTNLRTPRFDLDSLYGDGPDAHPFMYDDDGASLLFKNSFTNQSQSSFDQAHQDLLRSPNGRAIIGDKRNDENSLVSQIHLTFVKFHNAVVAKLKLKEPTLAGTNLFDRARNEVRWAYQKLVIDDFLPRIVKCEVLADLQQAKNKEERKSCYALYPEDANPDLNKRKNLPREFVVAAYRFGHSGVRFGYRLNTEKRLSIFPPSNHPTDDSLLGFDPLPQNHVIDNWSRFFPIDKTPLVTLGDPPKIKRGKDIPNPAVRLQFAYKIDTNLVDPLTVLPANVLPTSPNPGGALQELKDTIKLPLPEPKERPSLALLNLIRGNTYKVQGGQAIAAKLRSHGLTKAVDLTKDQLSIRTAVADKKFEYVPIHTAVSEFNGDTPLWFYILAEAQADLVDRFHANRPFPEDELLKDSGNKTQLGWVGGRIVAEVFYGLIDSDDESYVNHQDIPKDWEPIWASDRDIGNAVIFANLLKFAGQPISPIPKVAV